MMQYSTKTKIEKFLALLKKQSFLDRELMYCLICQDKSDFHINNTSVAVYIRTNQDFDENSKTFHRYFSYTDLKTKESVEVRLYAQYSTDLELYNKLVSDILKESEQNHSNAKLCKLLIKYKIIE
jgi:hypothetical protein